jgi:hypothetical protein
VSERARPSGVCLFVFFFFVFLADPAAAAPSTFSRSTQSWARFQQRHQSRHLSSLHHAARVAQAGLPGYPTNRFVLALQQKKKKKKRKKKTTLAHHLFLFNFFLAQLLAELPPEFYQQDFDASLYIIEAMPDDLNCMSLLFSVSFSDACFFFFPFSFHTPVGTSDTSTARTRKFQELQAVSTKLAALVMDHHNDFVQELARVSDLQEDLKAATTICMSERSHLDRHRATVKHALGLIRTQRKRAITTDLLNTCTTIGPSVTQHRQAAS